MKSTMQPPFEKQLIKIINFKCSKKRAQLFLKMFGYGRPSPLHSLVVHLFHDLLGLKFLTWLGHSCLIEHRFKHASQIFKICYVLVAWKYNQPLTFFRAATITIKLLSSFRYYKKRFTLASFYYLPKQHPWRKPSNNSVIS